LSKSEASIAAPFTSNVENISSVADLLRIGRCSLDLSYMIFKYMLVYSSMEFTSVVILYFHTSSISDSQLVFIDFFCVAPLTIFLCSLDEKSRLEPRFPSASLLSRKIQFSLITQMIIQGLSVMFIFFLLESQESFTQNVKSDSLRNGKIFMLILSNC
jgi:cation-transporting ATPase 13A2